MNGGEQLHSTLFRSGGAALQCICGGNAHEQNKTNSCGCCTLWRSSRFSSNVRCFRRPSGANWQSRHRERFSFEGLLWVLSPSPSSLRLLSPSPSSSLLVAPRLSPLPLVVSPICT